MAIDSTDQACKRYSLNILIFIECIIAAVCVLRNDLLGFIEVLDGRFSVACAFLVPYRPVAENAVADCLAPMETDSIFFLTMNILLHLQAHFRRRTD